MRVVVRLIYYKAVNPSCDVIEMDSQLWNRFLYGSFYERLEIAGRLLNRDLSGLVRELAWIPLDGQDKVIINPNLNVI